MKALLHSNADPAPYQVHRPFRRTKSLARAILLVTVLALAFGSAPTLLAQVTLTKIGNKGTFVRMKPTIIHDKSYSVMLFDQIVVMLDQNGELVGDATVTSGRALATMDDTIYVYGKRTAAGAFELIKLRFIPTEKKFEVVGTAQPIPTNWGEKDSVNNDMCVTRLNKDGDPDVKIWVASPYANIIETARWSDPSRDASVKLDTIPPNGDGGTDKNYIRGTGTVSPQSHNY